MLRQGPELLATIMILEVTLATGAITGATGDVAGAEAGVMIVEIVVANLKENTGIDEMIEDRLHHFVMREVESDGDENHTEAAEHHLLRAEADHQITPHAIVEMHRQTST
jgi:hypothetical protein